MGETYPFLYIEIKQQSSLQNSAMSYIQIKIRRADNEDIQQHSRAKRIPGIW